MTAIFFVSLNEITPPALKDFDLVRDDVDQRWRAEERTRRISTTIRSVIDAVKGGEELNAAASKFDRAPIEIVIDRRFDNETISPAFNEQIFAATPNDLVSAPVAIGDAQVVAQILDVGSTRGRIPPDQVALFEQYIGYQLDQELIEAFLLAVRNDSKIKINQAQIDALFSEGVVTIAPAYPAFEDAYNVRKAQLVWRRVVSDLETPVSAFLKLCQNRKNSILLESVEGRRTTWSLFNNRI